MEDSLQDGVEVDENLFVAESQNLITEGAQLLGSGLVVFHLVVVHPGVHFDHQPERRAAEVEDERSNRMLAAEPQPIELSSLESLPQLSSAGVGLRRSSRAATATFAGVPRTRGAVLSSDFMGRAQLSHPRTLFA